MKRLLFTLAALLMVGSAFAQDAQNYFTIDDFEVAQDQLGTNNVRVNVKAHFVNYVSAWRVNFTYPEGITCRGFVKGSDLALSYYDELGDVQTLVPALNKNADYTRCLVASTEAAYDADGNFMGAAMWAPGEYEQMWQLVLVVAEDFAGGEMMLHSEPACSGWGDHSNDCPKATYRDTYTQITVDPPTLYLTGYLSFGDITGAGKLPISYTGPEEVTITVTVNGATVPLENGMVQLIEGNNNVVVTVNAQGYNPMIASKTVNWTIPIAPNHGFLIDSVSVYHGGTIVIPVQLINESNVLAFQTDIVLPEGFIIATDEDNEPMITPSDRLTNGHVVMADRLNDGSIRVICYTLTSEEIIGNEGDLFYFTVTVPQDAEGDYSILLRNSLLTAADCNEFYLPDTRGVLHVDAYLPGDVNDSGTVTVTDIVFIAHYILQHNPSPFIFAAADMNHDGTITVTDIILLAKLIMPSSMNVPMRMPALWNNGDRMSGEDVTLMPGETRTVSIALDNEMAYSAFQLDLNLPEGLTASNFQVTNRASSHAFEVSTLQNGNIRALCYSPAIETIDGNSGALLTFDVTAAGSATDNITVDGIELVTADCRTVKLDAFGISVNNATGVNDLSVDKTIASVDYFNLAGQRLDRPESGVTLVVTTFTDGTRATAKVIR